jgi:hypothetical protein
MVVMMSWIHEKVRNKLTINLLHINIVLDLHKDFEQKISKAKSIIHQVTIDVNYNFCLALSIAASFL